MVLVFRRLGAALALTSEVAAASGRIAPGRRGRTLRSCLACAAIAILAAGILDGGARANSFVRMDFNVQHPTRNRGTVFIELFDDRPLARDNFLQYVNGGHYDGSLMHRLSRNFVLQGGGFYPEYVDEPAPIYTSLDPTVMVDLDGNPATDNPTIDNEFTNSPFRTNAKGTLSMAKQEDDPNSASSEYFFNLKDNAGTPPLGLDYQNGGFTVFARVVGDGMNLLDAYNGTTPQSGLPTLNLNPDTNDDGVQELGPFGTVPILTNGSTFIPLVLTDAEQIDYFGAGTVTNVPAGGYSFSARDAFIDTGSSFSGSGVLSIAAGRKLGVREEITLTQTLINSGTLAPGLSLGSVTLYGANYFQTASGVLEIQLSGTTPDTQYDQLVVHGAAYLDGKLSVSFMNGYSPAAGDSFNILATVASIVGDFSSIDLPMLSAGLVWSVGRTSNAITLSVVAADFNMDGVVDAADYVLWRKNDGSGASYNLWRSNLGNVRGTVSGGSGSQQASVTPEPAGMLHFLAAGLLLAAGRRRRVV